MSGNSSGAGSAEYYRVGVEMFMAGSLISGLNHVAGTFIALNKHADEFNRRVQHGMRDTETVVMRLQSAMIALGGAVAGIAILDFGKHLADAGGKFQTIESRMRMGGWKDHGAPDDVTAMLPENLRPKGDHHDTGDIAQARESAFRLSGKYAISPEEIMKLQMESAYVFGNRTHAIEYAETMAKFMTSVQASLGGEKGRSVEKEVMDGIRALELKGVANDPQQFFKMMQAMAQSLNASTGTVRPHDMMVALRQARTAGFVMDDNFFRYIFPTLMQEVGGSTTGSSLMTLQQQAMKQTFTNAQIDTWKKMGLLEPNTKFASGGMGGKMAIVGGIVGRRTLRTNVWDWIQQFLIPRLQRRGLNLENKEDMIQATDIIGRMFPDRTASDMVTKLLTQAVKVRKDASMDAQATNMDVAAIEAINRNYEMVMENLHVKTHRIQTILGYSASGPVMEWVVSFNEKLAELGDWMVLHPDIGKNIVNSIMAVGAAIIGFSLIAAAMLVAAIVGWPIAIGGAIVIFGAALVGYFWAEIKTWPKRILSAFTFGNFGKNPVVPFGAETMPSQSGSPAPPVNDKARQFDRFQMPDRAPPGFRKQSFAVPPPSSSGQSPMVIKTALHMDARKVGEIVSQYIAQSGHFVSGPSGFDGMMAPINVDSTLL